MNEADAKCDAREAIGTDQIANQLVAFAWNELGSGFINLPQLDALKITMQAYLNDIQKRGASIQSTPIRD